MLRRSRRFFAIVTFVVAPLAHAAGQATASRRVVAGDVVDSSGTAVAEASVTLRAGRDSVLVRTTQSGAFQTFWPVRGPFTVRVVRIGYAAAVRAIDSATPMPLRIVLRTEAAALSAIVVRGANAIETVRASPLAATAIDARDVTKQTQTATDVLDRAAGVRVRQSGGVGSTALLSIDGLTGSQIRTFVDGLPREFLGPAGTLDAQSLGTLDRIEVYKGVVPIEFGGDALGGAVNIVTDSRDGAAVSIGGGSFGRVTADLAGRRSTDRWTAALSGTHLAARNDYPIDVTIPDATGRPVPVRVRRFHDQYRIDRLTADVALLNRRWADSLRLRAFGADEARQLQHAPIMAQPYGAATTAESMYGALLGWALTRRATTVGAEAGVTMVPSTFVDTSLSVYDWRGDVVARRTYGGEIVGTRALLSLRSRNVLARARVATPLGPGTLSVTALHLGERRVGHDSIQASYYDGVDPFTRPSTLARTTLAAAYGAEWPAARLRADVAVKHYLYEAGGSATKNFQYVPVAPTRRERTGALAAAAWSPLPAVRLKTSFELATRLPDPSEVLGDYALVRPNPELRPEMSRNLNAAVALGAGGARAEVNGFYRSTTDIVFLHVSQFYALYENLLKARSVGVEGSAESPVGRWLSVSASGTYQDIRNRSPAGASATVADRYFDARLPNVPYLFGNAQLTAHRGASSQLWWSTTYVHRFFLYWETDGRADSKAVIPDQVVHNLGLSHALLRDRLRLTAEVQNLFDARAYDVFSVPRPGRALSLLARTTLR